METFTKLCKSTIIPAFVLILPMRNKKQRDARVARLYNLKINNGYNMFL